MNSTIKTIVVCVDSKTTVEYAIDTEIFDNPFVEASTRALEACRYKPHFKVRPAILCWDKLHQKDPHTYNAYFLMVFAGMHSRAELLREKFKYQYDIDLAQEPIHGKSVSK